MPTYEYECTTGHRLEKFQSITAKPLARCPRCKKKLRRLIGSGGGIIFKGSGFYETDYKRKSSPPEKTGEQKSAPEKSPAGSDTKATTAAAEKKSTPEASTKGAK